MMGGMPLKKTLFQESSPISIPARPKEQEEEDSELRGIGKIFNSVTQPKPEPVTEPAKPAEPKPAPKPEPQPVDEEDEDDDEWGAVPAFLRRSKLK